MPHESLTVVLPAYNEEARLGPALDELFGYLHRRGEEAREHRPGAGMLPERVHVLVVDDGSEDGTAALVLARPEAAAGELELLTVPHGGKGAAVRAVDCAAVGRRRETSMTCQTTRALGLPRRGSKGSCGAARSRR